MVDSSYTRSPWARVKAIWKVRGVFWLLVRRDLKVRYADSILGYFWTILDPLLMSFVYWAMFSVIMGRDVPGNDPYIVFLLAGMLPWQWFNSTMNQSSKAMKKASRLMATTNLPREIWVLRIVTANAVEYVFALPVLFAFAFIFDAPIHWEIVYTLLAAAILFVMLTGIGLLLAALTVLVPDIKRLLRIVTRLLFYASPILYSTDRLPVELQWVYVANPLADLLALFRTGFFPDMLNWWHVGYAAAMSLILFALGWWVFARLERTVLKEL
ncbi:ABC transporter permease [Mumia flava]|nr:ABC transporter permease [Mumia flava]